MIPPDKREEWIIRQARERPGAERAAFLDGACAGDLALRERLGRLLAAQDQPEEVLADGIDAATVKATIKLDLADASDEAVGQTLGRYKLLERVGEGGCGMVYVAEQKEPVRRKVALKVIKLGMDTKQVVARFEAERQALAMMDHPNIAKVLDAGTTELGRPFFVMELVRGIKITEYCDQANLATKERLDLFIKVCQAIQHAHQKGIIHRDIKPSNILVTLHDGVPVPKVIDFGIAKATQGELTDKTIHTQFQQFIGTPAYMSPEQAEISGLDIDTRSDIYSLGVLLYELLSGSTPFDAKELMASGIDAMRKTIREKEPQRPSTRLATLGADQLTTTAKRRSADTSKLLHQLKGDLDWIVMKCLEKDRQRRYDTANGLAADIKRHLDNEPVTARPPSAAYKFQKAFRRNKLVFAAGGAVVVGLLIGLAALAYALVRERALKSESARADSVATFVTGMLNKAVPQLVLQGNSKGIRVLLESADELVSTTLTNSPAAELTVRDALQYLYGGRLDDLISGMKQTDRMESLLPLVTDDRLPLNHSRDDLRIDVATARLWAGTVPRARADLEKLAEEFKQRGPAGNRARARILSNLGSFLTVLDKSPEAEPLLAEAYRLEPGRTGPGVYWEDFTSHPYSKALIQNGKYQLAEEVARLGISRFNAETLGKQGDLINATAITARVGYLPFYPQLVEAQCKLGRFHEAETLIEEQLGSGTAQPWPPLQIRSFKTLQLAVQAYSGQWRQAASGLIALATNSAADAWDWQRGVTAALAAGQTNTYASLCRLGRQRFAANAEAELASALFSGLILRPQEEDLAHTLPDLLDRVEEGRDYHWSAVTLLFWNSQLAYRKGEYEEALRFLEAWGQSRDERPQNAMVLRDLRASAVPDFWRAMILARLGRTDGALKAYGDGTRNLAASFQPSTDSFFVSLITFYTSHALQQEAREVLHSQGIAVPDTETKP